MTSRYKQKRHTGPGKETRHVEITTVKDKNGLFHHVRTTIGRRAMTFRDFWLHPTKGWRSSGPRA